MSPEERTDSGSVSRPCDRPQATSGRGSKKGKVRRDSASYVAGLRATIKKKQEELSRLEHVHTALQTWESVLQTSIVGMRCGVLQDISSSLAAQQHPGAAPGDADPSLQDVLSMEAQAHSQLAAAGVPAELESKLYTCTRLRAIAGTALVQHVQTASPAELGAGLAECVKQLAVLLYKQASAARAAQPDAAQPDAGADQPAAAADDPAELELLVDRFMDTALCLIFWEPDKAFHISSLNWATNEQCSAPPSHWAAAAQRLQPLLLPKQEQQLVLGFRLFASRRTALLEEQQQLLQQQGSDAAFFGQAQQEQQEQLLRWWQQHKGSSRRLQQMQRNVDALKVLSAAMWVLACNILSRRQLAELLVLCFPWQPCLLPVMQSLSEVATPETNELWGRLNRS